MAYNNTEYCNHYFDKQDACCFHSVHFSELTIIYEIANALMPFINHNEDVIFSNC